jgi:hypothetical protein
LLKLGFLLQKMVMCDRLNEKSRGHMACKAFPIFGQLTKRLSMDLLRNSQG